MGDNAALGTWGSSLRGYFSSMVLISFLFFFPPQPFSPSPVRTFISLNQPPVADRGRVRALRDADTGSGHSDRPLRKRRENARWNRSLIARGSLINHFLSVTPSSCQIPVADRGTPAFLHCCGLLSLHAERMERGLTARKTTTG